MSRSKVEIGHSRRFGRLVETWLAEQTKSQRKIQEDAELGNATISKWISGTQLPAQSYDELFKLMDAVGLPVIEAVRAVSYDRAEKHGLLQFFEAELKLLRDDPDDDEMEVIKALRRADLFEDDYRLLLGFTDLIDAARRGDAQNRPGALIRLGQSFAGIARKEQPQVLEMLATTVGMIAHIDRHQIGSVMHGVVANRMNKRKADQKED